MVTKMCLLRIGKTIPGGLQRSVRSSRAQPLIATRMWSIHRGALPERELPIPRTLIRPFNPRDMRHARLGEPRMELAQRLRRPLRDSLSAPAAGADDEPVTLGFRHGLFWRSLPTKNCG